jgi:hypothetical protein
MRRILTRAACRPPGRRRKHGARTHWTKCAAQHASRPTNNNRAPWRCNRKSKQFFLSIFLICSCVLAGARAWSKADERTSTAARSRRDVRGITDERARSRRHSRLAQAAPRARGHPARRGSVLGLTSERWPTRARRAIDLAAVWQIRRRERYFFPKSARPAKERPTSRNGLRGPLERPRATPGHLFGWQDDHGRPFGHLFRWQDDHRRPFGHLFRWQNDHRRPSGHLFRWQNDHRGRPGIYLDGKATIGGRSGIYLDGNPTIGSRPGIYLDGKRPWAAVRASV